MLVCTHCHLLLPDSIAKCPHDGAQSGPVQVPPLPPSLHAKFSQIEPYAQGQTGTCYLATQSQSGRRGLVKLIALSTMAPAERVRLKRELRKQTQLAHDGLPRIFDGGEIGSDLWMFRELVQGESLAQRIRRLGKLDVGEALTVTAQVASALDELQRSGLLHRDVKPGHIVLVRSAGAADGALPQAKLIDAGVAARLSTGSVFDLIGTPAYVSPEQVAGKLVSFRSDLYALGCVLYEMLQGEPPFPGGDVNSILEAHKKVAAPTLTLPLPPAVQTLLHAMLAKEPRQRPFSAQQVRRTLEPLLPAGARLPPLGARPVAPLAAGMATKAGSKFPREEDTQEIDLDDVALPVPGPQTMHLGESDLAEMAVPATIPPDTASVAASDARAVVFEDTSEQAAAPEPVAAESLARTAQEPQAPAPAAEAVPAAQAAVPARPSVAFDVESLFDDEVPAESRTPAQSEAPAGRGPDEDGPVTQLHRPAARYPGPAVQYETEPEAEADPEGTVLAARPGVRRRIPVAWLAGGGALLVVLLIVFSGGEDEPEPAAAEAEQSAQPTPVGSAPRDSAGSKRAGSSSAEEARRSAGEQAGKARGATSAAATQPAPAVPVAPVRESDKQEAPIDAKMPSQSGGGASKLAAQRASRPERLTKAEELEVQGRAHFQGGRFREAAAAYQKATELNPSDAGAFAGLGASRLEAGDANAAVQAYSSALRLQNSSSGFHAALGRAYLKKGDRNRARAAYARALELNPNNGAAKTALAQIR